MKYFLAYLDFVAANLRYKHLCRTEGADMVAIVLRFAEKRVDESGDEHKDSNDADREREAVGKIAEHQCIIEELTAPESQDYDIGYHLNITVGFVMYEQWQYASCKGDDKSNPDFQRNRSVFLAETLL